MALGDHVGLADRVRLVVDLLSEQAQPGARVADDQLFLGDRQHATGAGGGVVDGTDHAEFAERFVVAGEEQVHHQPDRIARGEVLTGGLVRGLGEASDQLLEQVTHVGVADRGRVQVDVGEPLYDQQQPVLLRHRRDLGIELEPTEHVDVGREVVDVVAQVRLQPVRVTDQLLQAPHRRVVKRQPGEALHPYGKQLRAWLLGGLGEDLVAMRLQHAVQPAQDRHREDHVAVLMRLVDPPQLVGDRPYEPTQLVHPQPPDPAATPADTSRFPSRCGSAGIWKAQRGRLLKARTTATAFAWVSEGRLLTISGLSALQGALMAGTSAQREHSGQLRPVQVVIGRRESAPLTEIPIKSARFVPPPGPDLESRVRDLMAWVNADHTPRIDPVVAAAMAHYQFEALHPFHDGNGRLGRLLIVLHLHAWGLLQEPTLSVSPWFEERRTAYYDALFGVSARGDWSAWVEFFALGLTESAQATQRRMLALATVQSELKQMLVSAGSKSPNARLLVDFAVANPTLTVSQAAARLSMTHPGASKLVDSLVGYGILAPYGERTYNRRFHAPRVLDVLLAS